MRILEEILKNSQFKPISVMTDGQDVRIDGNFFDPVSQKRYFTIFTSSMGWEHASVSQPNKTPSWEIMCRVKDIFWTEDECCIEYHPKKEDYINNHEHCLHIWKPIGVELPMPPSIMVGIKDMDSSDSKIISKALVSQMSLEEMCEKAGFQPNRKMRRKKQ